MEGVLEVEGAVVPRPQPNNLTERSILVAALTRHCGRREPSRRRGTVECRRPSHRAGMMSLGQPLAALRIRPVGAVLRERSILGGASVPGLGLRLEKPRANGGVR